MLSIIQGILAQIPGEPPPPSREPEPPTGPSPAGGDFFAPLLDWLTPLWEPRPPSRTFPTLPPVPLTVRETLARIASGTIYHLEIPLPAGELTRTFFCDLAKLDIAIAPGTRLVGDNIELGPQGRLERGALSFEGPEPDPGEDDGFYHFEVATPEYIRFEEGRAYLKIDWLGPDRLGNWLAETVSDGLTFNDAGELDITRAITARLGPPEQEWSLAALAEHLPQILRAGEELTSDWTTRLQTDWLSLVDGIRLNAELQMTNPLYHDPDKRTTLTSPTIQLRMEGLALLEATLLTPEIELPFSPGPDAFRAHSLTLGVQGLSSSSEGGVQGIMTLDAVGAIVRLPGRIRPDPIFLHLHEFGEPDLTIPFELSASGLTLSPRLPRVVFDTESQAEFHAEVATSGEGTVFVSTDGRVTFDNHLTTEIEAPFAWFLQDLSIGARMFCEIDLHTAEWRKEPLVVDYDCEAPKGEANWFNENRERIFHGSIRPTGNATFPFGYEVLVPKLVQGFQLKASSNTEPEAGHFHGRLVLNPQAHETELVVSAGNLREFRFVIDDEAVMHFSIAEYRSRIESLLSSRFLQNPMWSDITVERLKATLEGGELVITAENEGEVFLETRARGSLQLANFERPIPIHGGRLKITKIRYDHDAATAEFTGQIALATRFNPADRSDPWPIDLLQASGDPQEFWVSISMQNALFDRNGVILPTGQFRVRAIHRQSLPTQEWEWELPPRHYPFTPPPLAPSARTPYLPEPSLQDLSAAYGPGALSSIGSVRQAGIELQHGTGRIYVSFNELLRRELGVNLLPPGTGLRFDFDEPSALAVRAETELGEPGEGEVLRRFVIGFRDPPDVCFTIGGRCITLPGWRLRQIYLVPKDDPPPRSDPFTGGSDSYHGGRRAGELIVDFEGAGDESLANLLLSEFDIDRNTFERAGIELHDRSLVIPVRLDQLQRLLATAWPNLMSRAGELRHPPASEPQVFRFDLPIDWLASPSVIDLDIVPNVYNICSVPLGGTHREGDIWAQHPHVVIEPAFGSRLRFGHHGGSDEWILEGMGFRRFDFYPNIEHQTDTTSVAQSREERHPTLPRHEAIHVRQARTNNWRIEHDGERFAARGHLDIDEMAVELEHQQGTLNTLRIDNPFLRLESPTEPAELGAGRIAIGHAYLADTARGVAVTAAPTLTNVTAHFNNNFLEIGASSLDTDTLTFRHRHFAVQDVRGIEAQAVRVFIPVVATPDRLGALALGDGIRLQAERIEIGEGTGQLHFGTDSFDIGGHTSLRSVLITALTERILFEAGEAHIHLREVPVRFLEKFPLPEGLEIRTLRLQDIYLTGVIRDSSFEEGNIVLQGDLRMTTAGEAELTYRGQHLRSPLTVTIEHIGRMALAQEEVGGEQKLRLQELAFGGATIGLRDLDASLNWGEVLSAHFHQLARSSGTPLLSTMTIEVGRGRIGFERDGTRHLPEVSLEGVVITGASYSDQASFHPPTGSSTRAHFRYPWLATDYLFRGNIRITQSPGAEPEIAVQVYDFDWKAFLKRAEARVR